jgi:thiamine pyrophosphate-dependent acetolactate synthase large subunit-like protein
MNSKIMVSEVLSKVSLRFEVEHIFGLLGEGNLNLVLACEKHGQKWVAVRHEMASVVAAESYSQSKGLGVAFVTHGPALLNALNPLMAGLKSRSPLILVTGEIDDANSSAPQWCDQRRIIQSLGISYFRVDAPSSALRVIAEAFRFAIQEQVPVVLAIPTSMQTAYLEDSSEIEILASKNQSIFETGLVSNNFHVFENDQNNFELGDLVEMIQVSQFPVILAGRGAFHAKTEILRLGKKIGALMATTLLGKGLFSDSEWGIGFVGGFQKTFTYEFLNKADLILVFGASLNQFTLGYSDVFKHKQLISINLVKGIADGKLKNLHEFVGDSALTARKLTDSLAAEQTGFRSQAVQREIREFNIESEFEDRSGINGLDSRRISCFLEFNVPTLRGFTADLGYFTSEPVKFIDVKDPKHFGWPLSFGSIGVGLSSAIGLSFANPHLPIICAIGDGGLMSCIQELDTVSRYNLPIIISVFNDSSYNVEYQFLTETKDNLSISIFKERNFADIAAAFEIQSFEAKTVSDLTPLAEQLQEINGPILIDFKVDRSIITKWWEDILQIVRHGK